MTEPERRLSANVEITPEVAHLLKKTPEERQSTWVRNHKHPEKVQWTQGLAEQAKATTRPKRS